MDDSRREKEEYLERLWEMREQGLNLIADVIPPLGDKFKPEIIDELALAGLVTLDEHGGRISLTETGAQRAKQIIRAHRIGERLLFDVFGSDFESGACEFEHTTTVALVDALCTLLGHPRECPHGQHIPEGECCLRSARTVPSAVVPLKDLEIGQSARIAYINCRDDCRMHKLESLQIRPGNMIKLHQRYPCYVIECEGASIALDEEIVASVQVWAGPTMRPQVEKKPVENGKPTGSWWGKGLGFGRKWRKNQRS